MRSILQLDVQKRAAIAAIVTAMACYPRLALWPNRPGSLWTLMLTLAWGAFIFWAFVFAWHEKYSGQKVFTLQIPPVLWAMATVCGILGAIFLHVAIDRELRPLLPAEYPTTVYEWAAMTLSSLAFEQLCVCFAPFAFFIRLLRRRDVAVGLTVLLGVFIMYLKLRSIPVSVPAPLVLTLVAMRIVTNFLSAVFYLNGGAVLVLWWIFLLQLRHIISLLG